MKKRICPICDKTMQSAHYCSNCRSFVRNPWIRDVEYYLNERHPSAWHDCTYHEESAHMVGGQSGSGARTASRSAASAGTRTASRSAASAGTKAASRSATVSGNAGKKKEKKKGNRIVLIIVLIYLAIQIVIPLVVGLMNSVFWYWF